jgi:hypothetical protein
MRGKDANDENTSPRPTCAAAGDVSRPVSEGPWKCAN